MALVHIFHYNYMYSASLICWLLDGYLHPGKYHWVSICFTNWYLLCFCSNFVTGPTFCVSAFSSTQSISDSVLDHINTTHIVAQGVRRGMQDDIGALTNMIILWCYWWDNINDE